jgi:hypothetical protein
MTRPTGRNWSGTPVPTTKYEESVTYFRKIPGSQER